MKTHFFHISIGFALMLGCGDVPPNGVESPAGRDDAAFEQPDTGHRDETDGTDLPALVLPIEVLGLVDAGGPTVVATIELPTGTEARAGALRLSLNNIVEPDSAQLLVNDAVFDLSDPALGFVLPAGGVATARLELGEGVLRSGVNTLAFSYTRQVPDVSGYRVLDLSVELDGEEAALRREVTDPAKWTGFADDADALERGRRFFTEVSRDGGPVCSVCHADSGVDLNYFAFSNRSIVARAMLHEFSESESQDIASYIRSLGSAVGRPFDGPFQPGPTNFASAGAGWNATVTDAEFGEHVFGRELDDEPAWDAVADLDPFALPSTVQTPTWFRWLPRRIDESWFTWNDSALTESLDALRASPTDQNADAFMETAVELGKQLILQADDHAGRIELLRFAATKLWDFSLGRGFEAVDRGFPTHGPSYPYEVGFAFFEAARDDVMGADAWEQTRTWWWAQIAVNSGRGAATSDRPLNWEDTLLAAEAAGAGPNELVYLHLAGTLQDSLGQRAGDFGTQRGPVRLLVVTLRNIEPAMRVKLWRRYLKRERAEVEAHTSFDATYNAVLREAWDTTCSAIPLEHREELATLATQHSLEVLSSCNQP